MIGIPNGIGIVTGGVPTGEVAAVGETMGDTIIGEARTGAVAGIDSGAA